MSDDTPIPDPVWEQSAPAPLPEAEQIPVPEITRHVTATWAERCLAIADEMARAAAFAGHHRTEPGIFPNGSALRQMLVEHLTKNDGTNLELWG